MLKGDSWSSGKGGGGGILDTEECKARPGLKVLGMKF